MEANRRISLYRKDESNKILSQDRGLFIKYLKKRKPPYVEDLIYDEDTINSENHLKELFKKGEINVFDYKAVKGMAENEDTCFFTFGPLKNYGKRIPQRIFIKPYAFDFMNEREFIIGLEHHEYTHAKDIFEGIPLKENEKIDHSNIHYLNRKTINLINEIRANLNQLEALLDSGIFKEGVSHNPLIDIYLERKELYNILPENPFEKKVKDFYLEESEKRIEEYCKKFDKQIS